MVASLCSISNVFSVYPHGVFIASLVFPCGLSLYARSHSKEGRLTTTYQRDRIAKSRRGRAVRNARMKGGMTALLQVLLALILGPRFVTARRRDGGSYIRGLANSSVEDDGQRRTSFLSNLFTMNGSRENTARADTAPVPSPPPTRHRNRLELVRPHHASRQPTRLPTRQPTPQVDVSEPVGSPSASPSAKPVTKSPSASPSATPTGSPSSSPSAKPTTGSPSSSPSAKPTGSPSASPSAKPVTKSPSASPSAKPTGSPSSSPSAKPTTGSPSSSPSAKPTLRAGDSGGPPEPPLGDFD